MNTYLEAPEYAISTSSLLGMNIFISTILADTLNPYSSISGITLTSLNMILLSTTLLTYVKCKLMIIYILLLFTNYPHSILYIDIISSFKFSVPMFVKSISQNYTWYIFNYYTYLTFCCWNSMLISDIPKTTIQTGLH